MEELAKTINEKNKEIENLKIKILLDNENNNKNNIISNNYNLLELNKKITEKNKGVENLRKKISELETSTNNKNSNYYNNIDDDQRLQKILWELEEQEKKSKI